MARASAVCRRWSDPIREQAEHRSAIARDVIVAAVGHWNHCDVWICADLNWFTSAVSLIIFGRQGAARVRLAVATLDTIARADADAAKAMVRVAGVRGIPCDAYEVEVQGFAGTIGAAVVYLECWGCDAAGSVTGTGGPSAGGALLLADADALPNQTAPAELSFPHVFNGTTWDRWYGSITLGGRVNETQAPQAEDNTVGVYAVTDKPFISTTYDGSLDTNLQAVTGRAIKGAAAAVQNVYAYNISAAPMILMLFDKVAAPANGDVPLVSFLVAAAGIVPNGVVIGHEWFGMRGKRFPTGLGAAWSTTVATLTLVGAATNLVWHIRYV